MTQIGQVESRACGVSRHTDRQDGGGTEEGTVEGTGGRDDEVGRSLPWKPSGCLLSLMTLQLQCILSTDWWWSVFLKFLV